MDVGVVSGFEDYESEDDIDSWIAETKDLLSRVKGLQQKQGIKGRARALSLFTGTARNLEAGLLMARDFPAEYNHFLEDWRIQFFRGVCRKYFGRESPTAVSNLRKDVLLALKTGRNRLNYRQREHLRKFLELLAKELRWEFVLDKVLSTPEAEVN